MLLSQVNKAIKMWQKKTGGEVEGGVTMKALSQCISTMCLATSLPDNGSTALHNIFNPKAFEEIR